jgi:hypothetical protein
MEDVNFGSRTLSYCPQKPVTKMRSSLVIASFNLLLEPLLFYTASVITALCLVSCLGKRSRKHFFHHMKIISEDGTRMPGYLGRNLL